MKPAKNDSAVVNGTVREERDENSLYETFGFKTHPADPLVAMTTDEADDSTLRQYFHFDIFVTFKCSVKFRLLEPDRQDFTECFTKPTRGLG